MASRTLSCLVFFAMLGALALRLHGLSHSPEADTLAREQATYHYLRKVIQENYVKEVKDEKLFYGAMEGMAALDPHSGFMPPDVYGPFLISTTGHFVGVGINLNPDDSHGLVVLTPLQNTPAYRAGILPGDRIIKIDGASTQGMSQEECGHRIKGPEGSAVRLTLLHDGDSQPVELTLLREMIEIKSVQGAEILGPPLVQAEDGKPASRIGYVQLTQFQEKTAADLDAALKTLEQQGMQALILDLRENGGGLLDQAEKVGDLFLKDGLIVTVITRAASESKGLEEVRRARGIGTHPDYPMVVLVDSLSASASEVVAGALKDRGRAILVGDKTYGKFSVQRTFEVPMDDGKLAALKLTIARYKTPTSPCVDGEGLVPDYLLPSTPEQQNALQVSRLQRQLKENDPRPNRNPHSHSAAAGGTVQPNEIEQKPARVGEAAPGPKPFVDFQLEKAVEVLQARLKKN